MEEIKKFLRLMEKEELVSLCASMMFQNLVNAVDLAKAISTYDKEVEDGKRKDVYTLQSGRL